MFARGPQLGTRWFFLTLLSILLMVLDQRAHYLIPLRNGLSMLVLPMQYLVHKPLHGWQVLNNNLASREQLLADNATLRAQQLLLAAQLQQYRSLENENAQLRALLQSSPHLQNRRIVIAHLLEVSTDPLIGEMILDKGHGGGVFVGQPVLDAQGVMGQIIQVGPLTSRLLLISDVRSAVPVQNTRNGVRGIVVGQGPLATLLLTNIPDTVDIKVNDLLVTSGLGGHYPAGYPVGTVIKMQHETGEQFAHIEIKPSAQLNRNRPMLLIWPAALSTSNVPRSTVANIKTLATKHAASGSKQS